MSNYMLGKVKKLHSSILNYAADKIRRIRGICSPPMALGVLFRFVVFCKDSLQTKEDRLKQNEDGSLYQISKIRLR